MRVVAFDTETALIRPGLLAPPLVCVSYQVEDGAATLVAGQDAELWFTDALCGGGYLFVGHNVSYDLAVIFEAYPNLRRHIFDAYVTGRVTDTKIRQQLLDIAGGVYRGKLNEKGVWVPHAYALLDLARRCAGLPFKKEGFRLFYGPLQGVPLAQWPEHARALQARGRAFQGGAIDNELSYIQTVIADDKRFAAELAGMIAADPNEVISYPLDDARATLAIYRSQEVHSSFLKDQFRQAQAAWALHCTSAWGMRTAAPEVEALRKATTEAHREVEIELQAAGLIKPDGVRDTKFAKARMIAVCKKEGLPLRRTATHADPDAKCQGSSDCTEHVALDADACAATGDHLLGQYAEASTLKKVLSNDVEMLSKGTERPVNPSYGMAETGRGTCAKPNIQNVGKRAGIRECFIPRPGMVFMQADFPQLELYCLAQACVSWLGESKLGDALNAGLDPHLAMAAQILGCTYQDAKGNLKTSEVNNARQTAKVANFGFPGGLGLEKLILFARKTYKVELTQERARQLKAQWFETWTEMPRYFARINALCDNDSGRATVESLFTQRIRGGATYCAACNNGFQALGADCAKHAAWLICCAQYNEPDSPLYNTRNCAFVHDEFLGEVEDTPAAHDAAQELARLMVVGANKYLPDVPIPLSKMEPLLMRRWSKAAVPVRDSSGRLIPWQV